MIRVTIFVLTLTIIAAFCIQESRASIPPFCTNWNTNITQVCRAIKSAHKFMNKYVPKFTKIRHCNLLLFTPHCCEQFCKPAATGSCHQRTGACICKGNGTPEICNAYFKGGDPSTDPKVLARCNDKCKSANGACQTPAYFNDGFNFLCVCYCP